MRSRFFVTLCILVLLCMVATVSFASADSGQVKSSSDFMRMLGCGPLVLDRNITISAVKTIPLNGVHLLDLNGHKLTANQTLQVNGTLIITDSEFGGELNAPVSISNKGRIEAAGGVFTGGIQSRGQLSMTDSVVERSTLNVNGGKSFLTNCEIMHSGNSGIKVNGGILVAKGCDIHDCRTSSDGGGISIFSGTTYLMDNCRITNNSASHAGGGIYARTGKLYIVEADISNNKATAGGGIYCDDYSNIYLCAPDNQPHAITITNNSATGDSYSGGGIGGSGTESSGGALYVYDACITNNRVIGETGSQKLGGGIAACYQADLRLLEQNNCNVYGNTVSKSSVCPDSNDIWSNALTTVYTGDIAYTGRKLKDAYVKRLATRMPGNIEQNTTKVNLGAHEEFEGAWVQLTSNLSNTPMAQQNEWYENAGVLIENNTSESFGGGLGSNGYIQLGGEKPTLNVPEYSNVPQIGTVSSIEPDRITKGLPHAELYAASGVHPYYSIWDNVFYTGLTPGVTYTFTTTVNYGDTHERVYKHDALTTQFKATKPNGWFQVELPVDFRDDNPDRLEVLVCQEVKIGDEVLIPHDGYWTGDQYLGLGAYMTTIASSVKDDYNSKLPVEWTTSTKIYDRVYYGGIRTGEDMVMKTTVKALTSNRPVIDLEHAIITNFVSVPHGTLDVEIPINTNLFPEETLLVCQSLYNKEGELVLAHADPYDDHQKLEVKAGPQLITSASIDKSEIIRKTSFVKRGTIYDTVAFENLEVGKQYTLQPSISGNALSVSTKPYTFTATAPSGSVTIPMSYTREIGGSVVIMEELFDATGLLVAYHKDRSDAAQTITVPKLPAINSTKASVPSGSADGLIPFNKHTAIHDRVYCADLINNYVYTLKTFVYSATTRQLAGAQEQTFTADNSYMTFDVTVPIDSRTFADETLVVFQEIWADGVCLATHHDWNEKDQQAAVASAPLLETIASSSADGVKKTISWNEDMIYDTVFLTDLDPNEAYTLKSFIFDAETKNPVVSKDDAATTAIPAGSTQHTITVPISCKDLHLLGGKPLVVFQELYAADGVLVSAHKDFLNEEQQVAVTAAPTIHTLAGAVSGTKIVPWSKTAAIRDTVVLDNLAPGETYTLKAVVVHTETGAILTDAPAISTFTALSSMFTKVVDIPCNTRKYMGEKLTVLQELYASDGCLLAEHKNIEDETQQVTVEVPKLTTAARSFCDPESQIVPWSAQSKIMDTVTYEGLDPGETYQLRTTLFEVDSQVALISLYRAIVTPVTPAQRSGELTVEIPYDTRKYTGRKLVVFQDLYTENREKVASHRDYDNENQQVTIGPRPVISTHASSAQTGSPVRNLEWSEGAIIYDTVHYKNLIPGYTYYLEPSVRRVKTKEIITDALPRVKLIPETPEGDIVVPIPCSTLSYPQETLTVMEKLYEGNTLAAAHTDLYDPNQQLQTERGNIEITTVAKIQGERNGQTVTFSGNSEVDVLPIQETVTLKNITLDMNYYIVYKVMDQKSGQEIYRRAQPFMKTSEEGAESYTVTMRNLRLPMYRLTGPNAVVTIELRENSEDGVIAAVHDDLLDTSETVTVGDARSVTSSSTAVLAQPQASEVLALNDWTLTDTFHIDDEGKWIEGGYLRTKLLDKETEEVLFETKRQVNDTYGGWTDQTVEITKDTQGIVKGKNLLALHEDATTFSPASLAGRELVVYEELIYFGKRVAHTEINDKAQTVVFEGPVMTTETDTHVANATNGIKVKDAVRIEGWPASQTALPASAVLKGYAVQKGTNTLIAAASKPVGGTPVSEGSVSLENEFTLDLTKYRNSEIIILEELWVDDTVAVSHEDLSDKKQMISVDRVDPTISTVALSDLDDNKTLVNARDCTITDTVTLQNLMAGREYTLTATLFDKKNGREIQTPKTETRFTASPDDVMSKEIQQTIPYEAFIPCGSDIVVYERLYLDGDLVAEHANPGDADQTLRVESVEIQTAASGADGTRTIPATGYIEIADHLLSAAGIFEPGMLYTVKTTAVRKDTGEPVKLNGDLYEKTQTVDVDFSGQLNEVITLGIDTFGLADAQIVLFDEIYTMDGVLATSHRDINSESQTLTFTKGAAVSTIASDPTGSKFIDPAKGKVIDKISYRGLFPEMEYTVNGSLVSLLSDEVIAEASMTFTAEHEDGELEMQFQFDATEHIGDTFVIFQEILDASGTLIAEHRSAGNVSQQVTVMPFISTYAVAENGSSAAAAAPDLTITDRVTCSALRPNTAYIFEGSVVRSDTGEALTSQEFRYRSDSEGNLEFDADFTVDAAGLEGIRLVVTYAVTQNETLVAEHKDLTDIDQSVMITGEGQIAALMTDLRSPNSEKTAFVKKGDPAECTDHVIISLVGSARLPSTLGIQYYLETTLFDSETDEQIGDAFRTPCSLPGSADVPVSFVYDGERDREIYVSQKLIAVRSAGRENIICEHDGRNDPAQHLLVRRPALYTSASGDADDLVPVKTTP